jgi:alkaline phosphatase
VPGLRHLTKEECQRQGGCRSQYGTAGGNPAAAAPPSQQHTGSVVPIWGRGPGAAAILGTTDHTDLFGVLQGDDGHRH